MAVLEGTTDIDARKRARVEFAGVAGAVVAAGVFLHFVNPEGSRFLPPCPFHLLTGLYCPGCGTLRGLHALLRGDLAAAVGYNVLMVAALPYLGYELASAGVRAWRGTGLRPVFTSARSIWVILAIIMAYWVLRNVPVWPFAMLGAFAPS